MILLTGFNSISKQISDYLKSKPISYNADMKKVGIAGENIIYKFLWDQADTLNVDVVTEEKKFQRLEVDFLVESFFGDYSIEAKNDSKMCASGNVFLELYREYHLYSMKRYFWEGWFTRSKADYLMIYSKIDNKIYKCKFDYLRMAIHYYEHNHGELKVRRLKSCDEFDTFYKLIPYEKIQKIFTVYDLNK